MPDHLDALIARSVDGSATIEPRVPALFEPNKLEREPAPEVTAEQPPTATAPQSEVRTTDRQALHVGRAVDVFRGTAHDRDLQAVGSDSKNDVGVQDRPDDLTARLATLEEQFRTRHARPTADLAALVRLAPVTDKPREMDLTSPLSDVVRGTAHGTDSDWSGLPPRPRSPIRSGPEEQRFGSRLDTFSHRLDSLARRLDERPGFLAELHREHQTGENNPTPRSASPDRNTRRADGRPLSPTVESRASRRATLQPVSASQHQTYVEVTIGRIELRAITAQERPKPARANSAAPTTLDDYLRRRNGGGR